LAVPSAVETPAVCSTTAAALEGQSVLLAYDGSPKADEALYVSTYLSAQWDIPLVVVTVEGEARSGEPGHTASLTLARAWKYLREHGVHATYVGKRGDVGDVVLDVAQEHESALIVMGGYGFSPMFRIVLGSAVDQVLRVSQRPVLICR
jgi:nucleotide-binding universal stress UspA family protein